MGRARPQADCHPDRPHYARGFCITCYKSDRRARNAEQVREYSRQWQREQRAKNPVRYRRREQAATYGMTAEQLDAMYNAQDSCCASCGEKHDRLQIDHDHQTGAVRGLLCGPCNSTAGRANDSVDRLMAVAAYLLRFEDVLRPIGGLQNGR